MTLELSIMHELQKFFSAPWAQQAAVVCARWIIFLLPLLALVVWKIKKISTRALVGLLAPGALAAVMALALELLLHRARPFTVDPNLLVLVPRPLTFSFPSAHASSAYALAFAILGRDGRLGILAVILADLVAVGRVVVGVHYPTDVLAGLVVGWFAFWIVRKIT